MKILASPLAPSLCEIDLERNGRIPNLNLMSGEERRAPGIAQKPEE